MAYLAAPGCFDLFKHRHPGEHTLQPSISYTTCCCNVPSNKAACKWVMAHPAWNVMQAEMAGTAETSAILDALNSQRADARERQAAMERQIREEARRLRGGIAGQPHATHSPICLHADWHVALLVFSRCRAAPLPLSQAAPCAQMLVDHTASLILVQPGLYQKR